MRLVVSSNAFLEVKRKMNPISTLSKAQQKAIYADKLVETTNALPQFQFFEKYCNSSTVDEAALKTCDLVGRDLDIITAYSESLKATEAGLLDACFNLIKASSAGDYQGSEMKWSPSKKRKEMLLPDMRYLVIKEKEATREGSPSRAVCGFISFMITYEDGYEVVYVYEIHLVPEFRGQGVGKVLLGMVEEIGRKVGVEKCMLTVFKANEGAVRWYHRMGYAVDDFSPEPRILRNGTVKEPSYLILSKQLR